jgi:hypothetical protein
MAEITPIQFLRGTAAAWTSANPTLAAGKPGFETDTGQLKIGDGSTAWNSLGYIGDGATGGPLSRTEPGTTLTVDDDDHNYIIEMSDGAGATITLPNTVAIGTYVTFIRGEGAGVTTFSPGGTSVFYTLGDEVTIDEERAWASWLKVSATEWYGAGGLGPVGTGGGGGTWGSIIGALEDQSDLQNALDAKADILITITAKTASYTLDADDLVDVNTGKSVIITMNVAGANNLTIPLNATHAFPVGTLIGIRQIGAGQTTVVPTGGVTLNAPLNAYKSATQNSIMFLEKTGTDTWYLNGETVI